MLRRIWNGAVDLFWESLPILFLLLLVFGGGAALMWWTLAPTTYRFENGTRLVVPSHAYTEDLRDDGYGICIESGVNVTAYNDTDELRSLIVSYQVPGLSILDHHAFEDLQPHSQKVFGAEPSEFAAMYVSMSDFAQKEREKETKEKEQKEENKPENDI